MASKATLENGVRKQFLDAIKAMVENQFESDALAISASEYAVPVTDAEGNEKWVIIKVSMKRGTRNDEHGYDEYDGYAEAAAYREALASKAQERAVRKAMKEAEKQNKKKNKEEGE